MIEIRDMRKEDIEQVLKNAKCFYNTDTDLRLRLEENILKSKVLVDELGRIGMVFGYYAIWEGVYEVWTVTTKAFDYHKLSYIKYIKKTLEQCLALPHIHRIQIYTKKKYPELRRWAEHLDFKLEGEHPQMGSDKEDYYSFGRIK
jgi:hypothetical protein